jgi:hypothetical protein
MHQPGVSSKDISAGNTWIRGKKARGVRAEGALKGRSRRLAGRF